jgi:hypothetical protein
LYGDLVRDYPRDRLALLIAHGLDFRCGLRDMLRDRIARVLPQWDRSVPQYGYLLGMHAFGLEENGDYARALTHAQRSLELVPRNASAIHVIAHVLEMQGTPEQGIAWLRRTQPIWSDNAGFRVHLAWHLALFQLDADAADDALATYDALIAPRLDGGNNGLVDASALLWRLQLRGTRSDRRWQKVTGLWIGRRMSGKPRIRPRACGDGFWRRPSSTALARDLAKRLTGDALLRSRSGHSELALAEPLAAAIMSFCRRRLRARIDCISSIRASADRCGGSIAQCDLIHLTLLEAALRGHRNPLARTLAAERAAAQAREPAQPLAEGTRVEPSAPSIWRRRPEYSRGDRNRPRDRNKFRNRAAPLVQWRLSAHGRQSVRETSHLHSGSGFSRRCRFRLGEPRADHAHRRSTRRFPLPPSAGAAAPPIAYEQVAGRAFGELDRSCPQRDHPGHRTGEGRRRQGALCRVVRDLQAGRHEQGERPDVARGAQSRPRLTPSLRRSRRSATSTSPARGRATTPAPPGAADGVGGRMQFLQVPVAKGPGGAPITGEVFGRIVNRSGKDSQPLWVQTNPVPYKPVSLDTTKSKLVSRGGEDLARRRDRRKGDSSRRLGRGPNAMRIRRSQARPTRGRSA